MEKFTDISYVRGSSHEKHQLDIFTPGGKEVYPVVIFIYGGSWHTGCKELYHPLGVNMAKKNMVAVIINYRLGGEADFRQMSQDCAVAIKWTYENIHQYQGRKESIFLAGHSAGGHLSALVALNKAFFESAEVNNPVKGCILIDAFGLNIDYVMFNNSSFFVKELQNVFTKDPGQWKDAAPVNHINGSKIPFLIFTGSRTYPYLTMDNEVFKMNLEDKKVPFIYKIIPGKNHVEMITSLQNASDETYKDITGFVMKYSGRE